MKRTKFVLASAIFLALQFPALGQNFPPPESMKDFSDGMIATPNTAMVIAPGVPADTRYIDGAVAGDASVQPSQSRYQPELPESGNDYEGPVGVTGIFNGNVTTGCSYDPLSHSANRAVDDIIVAGSIGKYPLKMTRYYNTRQQYYALTAIGLSPGWSHEYSWLLWGAGHKVVSPHGNVYDDYCGTLVGVSEGWDGPAPYASPSPSPGTGTWRLADGGRVHFENYQVTYIDDPYGLRTRIAYNQSGLQARQRVKVTEPGGRCLWFIYGDQNHGIDQGTEWGDWTWLLTRVEAYDVDGSPGTPSHPTGNLIGWVNYTYQTYDPITPALIQRRQKMLRYVDYSDNNRASYDYRTDNVTETQTTRKWYPLLQRADDLRYNGPMRTIRYEYLNGYPHGFISNEKYPNVGAVSAISPTGPDTFTETRGDGPTRTFTYTHLVPCIGDDCDGACAAYGESEPHNKMLTDYTDFRAHNTHIGYDQTTWYITSVTDANSHMTTYERGDPPPNGIGEIKTVTHPAGVGYPASSIHYDYYYPDPHYLRSVTDERGNATYLARDSNNRITEIDYKDNQGNIIAYEQFQQYNSLGQFQVHRLKNSAYESFAYDTRGLLTDRWNPKFGATPGGSDPHAHYDYYGPNDYTSTGELVGNVWIDRIKKVTMPINVSGYMATETYEYDRNAGNQPCHGRGLVTKIIHTDITSFQSFAYDQWGNKVDEWNELGENTHYLYDDYNRVISVTRANETTSYTYRPTNGNGTSPYLHTTNNPDTVTLPTGVMTTNIYDLNFRKTSSSVAGRTTWFDYDLVGNQTCITDPRGGGPCSSSFTTKTEYDTRNRKWHVWEGWGAQNYITTFTYDNASNVIRIDRPDNNWEEKTYDALNRVLTDTVSFTTSPNVNLTTSFTYNPSGTIWKITDPRATYTYHGDPSYTTTFEYNASDQRTRMTYPPLNGHSDCQSWDYDDAHNLKSRTTVNGETLLFGYDNRNREYGESWWQDNGEWRYFGFDGAGRLRRATNGIGLWWVNFISDVHRNYDANGRLTLDQQALFLPDLTTLTRNVTSEYDLSLRGAEGKPTRMYVTNENGAGIGYDYDFRYDDMGRFEKILAHGGANPSFQYYYDNASNETQRRNCLTGVDQFYNPDNLNRIGMVDLQKNGSFAHETYSYYPTGRLQTVTRENNKQDQFGYYLDGELYWVMYGVSGVQAPDPGQTPPAEDPDKEKTVDDFLSLSGWDPNLALTADRTVTYNMDYAGNRSSVIDSLTGTTAYQPNNLNQYINNIGVDAVTNGLEHEVASYKNILYAYMRDEHLMSAINTATGDTYQLAYDALGRCVRRTVHIGQDNPMASPTATPRPTPTPQPTLTPRPRPTPPGWGDVTKYYFYDGERPILDYNASAWLLGKNLYGKGMDEILMRYDSTVQISTFYYQQDHEGSVTHLTDGNGNVFEKYRYDVFGTPTIYDGNGTVRTASAVSNRFLFTGREYNALFGFYEYRARAYHPILGRFMSEDPKLFVRRAGLGLSPAGWTFAAHPEEAEFNLFRYCVNDPINNSDPTGLDSFQNADDSYSYILQHDLNPQSLKGSYVEHGFNRNNIDRSPVQCARTARVLAGTALGDGWHNAPSPEGGAWHQGAAVSNNTPVGSLVARGWEHGVYPNKGSTDESYKGHPENINHAGIFMGLSADGKNILVLDQFVDANGHAKLEVRPWLRGDWSQVVSNRAHESTPVPPLLRVKELR